MRCQPNEAELPQRMLVLPMVLMAASGVCAQPGPSPREVLESYCKLDASGKQLAVGGWRQLARMFIPERELSPSPLVVLFDKLEVIRGFSIGDPEMEDQNRVKLTVRYSFLGEIDYESLSFSSSKAPFMAKTGKNYKLLLTRKHYDIGPNDEEVLRSGSKAWRIVGLPPEPHITIDAAILYVTRLRDKATSASVKENANVTLDTLNRLRLNSAPDAHR